MSGAAGGGGNSDEGGGWGSKIYNNITRGVHLTEGLEALPKVWDSVKGLGKMPGLLGEGAGIAGDIAKLGGGTVGKALPIVGGVLSGGEAIYEGYEAYENFSKGGYHCDKAWNNVGGALLGGAGAGLAAATCTPLAPYAAVAGGALAVGEGIADGAGAAANWAFGKGADFSADNIVGGMARGMFGDKSWGEGVSNALGGGTLGHVAGTALNVLTMPEQALATAASGVANEVGAIGSAIWNGEGAVGGAIHDVGSGIASAASWVGGGISSVGSAIGSVLPTGW